MSMNYESFNKINPFSKSTVSLGTLFFLFVHLFIYPKIIADEKQKKLLPLSDGLVVLTFDDGNVSDLKRVAPLLKEYGFNATFFISGGFGIGRNGRLGWSEIKALDKLGFEVGNHTAFHPNLVTTSKSRIRSEIGDFDKECSKRGITQPISFAYPGGHADQKSIEVLVEQNYTFARRGTDPEQPLLDRGGRGVAYDPLKDHPLMMPSTLIVGPNTDLSDLKWAFGQARDGKIAVITFHGVPDVFPHCSTSPEKFSEHIQFLANHKAKVISNRELLKYVDTAKRSENYFDAIKDRLGIYPYDLRCEPSAHLRSFPRFSWKLSSLRRQQMQSAFQILVSSRKDLIEKDVGDFWDSGKVISSNSIHIPYQGKRLQGHRRYYWKVRVWNQPGNDGRYANRGYLDPQLVTALKVSRSSTYSPVHVIPPLDKFEQPTAHSSKDSSYRFKCSKLLISKIHSLVLHSFSACFQFRAEAVSENLLSLNMKIVEGIQKLFFEDIVGIHSISARHGSILIKPQFVEELIWVSAEMDTVLGKVSTRWERREDTIHLRVQLPANSKSEIHFPVPISPGGELTEGGLPFWQEENYTAGVSGILRAVRVGEVIVIQAGGGLYNFQIRH